MKFPWTVRAEKAQKEREDAELRRAQVEDDWNKIEPHRSSIAREIAMNDWTTTAISLFGGKGK